MISSHSISAASAAKPRIPVGPAITLDSHLRSILNKLGFDSRAQIAAWVATSQL